MPVEKENRTVTWEEFISLKIEKLPTAVLSVYIKKLSYWEVYWEVYWEFYWEVKSSKI